LAETEGVRGMPTLAIWAEREFIVSRGLAGIAADVGVAPWDPPMYEGFVDDIFGAKYPVVAIGEPEMDPVVYVVEYVPW
jgi:hypothetical protein